MLFWLLLELVVVGYCLFVLDCYGGWFLLWVSGLVCAWVGV